MLRGHRLISGSLCLGGLLLVCAASVDAGKTARQRPITRPGFDPTADRVELFDGMEGGQLATKVVAKNADGGSVLITNLTEEPLTVDLPEAFVAVQVNKQFGGAGGGNGGGGQNTGGGFGGGGGGGGGGPGGGGFGGGGGEGFFSIPPEQTVRLPYGSVCLNHGKPEPNSRTEMRMVPVESYTNDAVLVELIRMVGTGRMPHAAAQAAVWNRTDNMSWAELAQKTVSSRGRKKPYFQPAQLRRAQILTAEATGRARERADEEPRTETVQDRVPSRVRYQN